MAEDEKPNEEPKEEEKTEPEAPVPEGDKQPSGDTAGGKEFLKMAERLKSKEQEVLALEKRVDDKIKEWNNFMANTKLEGKAMLTPEAKTPKQIADDKSNEFANTIAESVGIKLGD